MDKDNYKWKFASVGGAARVDIQSGEDIAVITDAGNADIILQKAV